MNINVNVTISPSPELADLLRGLFSGAVIKTENPAPITEKKAPAKTKPAPVESVKQAEPETETKSIYSLEDVRAAAVTKSQAKAENPAKIREILAGFEVKKVTDLPADKYSEFIEKMRGL